MKSKINHYEKSVRHSQDELAVAYLPAVKAMAYRLKERLPASVDISDLVSVGIEELVKVARRYDSALNDSFWGYAKKRIYGSMLDYLRSLDVMSRSNRKLIKQIDAEIIKYLNVYEEEPTNEYLAKTLGESLDKINDARIAAEIYALMPLNDELTLQIATTMDMVQEEELIDIVKETLETLSEREQLVIQLYYFEELNIKEISDILDITQSRVSQIHKSVLAKIKERLGDING